jgi:membrane glycosyltransferase
MAGALRHLRRAPELLKEHLGSLSPAKPRRFGSVDVPLATATAKVEQCENLDDVAAWLDKPELRAVLEHPMLLKRVLELPPGSQE